LREHRIVELVDGVFVESTGDSTSTGIGQIFTGNMDVRGQRLKERTVRRVAGTASPAPWTTPSESTYLHPAFTRPAVTSSLTCAKVSDDRMQDLCRAAKLIH